MAFDDFHFVVIGNEPAGLWLLSALERGFQERGEQVRLGWISLDGDPTPICLPTPLGQIFGIGPSAPWSAEILTPNRCLPWTSRALGEHFVELPPLDCVRDPLQSLLMPSSIELAAIRSAIKRTPDLLFYAQGLWKAVGRARTLLPETLVHYARFLTTLQWWSPFKDLSSNVRRFGLKGADNPIDSIQFTAEGTSLSFKNFGEIRSRRWILNLDLRTLCTLSMECPEFLRLLNLSWDMTSLWAMYPLRLLVEPDAIASPVSALTIYYDTECIPDSLTEIWPLGLRAFEQLRELTVWVSAPGMVSLESVLDQFREGVKRANRVFPFLSQKLVHMPVPLGMDTCFEAPERRAVADLLQQTSWEKYDQTGAYTETRSPGLTLLQPYLGCHLPYPIGTLLAAKRFKDETLMRRHPLVKGIRDAVFRS